MTESTINNYTNPRQICNTPHFAAWGIAKRLGTFGWHNLRHRFLPPEIIGVTLRPVDPEAALTCGEAFSPEMFERGAAFCEVPLNHFVKIRPRGQQETFFVNAGYLLSHFIFSEALGYQEYVRLINDKTTKASVASKADSSLSQEGPSQQE